MTGDKPRTAAILAALFAVAAWGASFIATKIAVAEAAPMTIVWLRFAMGVAVLGVVVLSRRQLVKPAAGDLAYFALLGFSGIFLQQWLQANGLRTSQASTSAWIVSSIPVFMAILGWLVLGERMRLVAVFGIALAAAGVLVVVSRGDLSLLAQGRFGAPGDWLILASAPNWAIFSVLSRRGLQRFPSAGMMFWVMACGWLLTSALFFTGPGLADVSRLSLRGWLAVLFLGVVCSGLAYVFWYDALRWLSASQAGSLIYLEPLVAVVVAAALLGERVTLGTLAGGCAILLGVWMVSLKPRREEDPHPRSPLGAPASSRLQTKD